MGKNDKQIATWGDLESLGYRLPYGVKGVTKYQTKGVTYADLSYTQQGYLPAYKTEFEALSANQKRGYVTHNAVLDTTHHDTDATSAPITLGEDIRPLGNESTTFTHELEYLQSFGKPFNILWFYFPQKGDFGKITFKFPENPLYATVSTGGISNCNFTLKLYLKYGDTLDSATTLTTTEVAYNDSVLTSWYPTQENTRIAIDWPSTIDLSNFSGLKPGKTFFVVLGLSYGLINWGSGTSLGHLKFGYIKTTFHCGAGDGAKVHTYDASLCVPWNYIPASSPQSSAVSNPASVAIHCTIYNDKAGYTRACFLDFEYYYTLDGSTWQSTLVGYLDLGYSDDRIPEYSSDGGTVYLRLNPQVSGTVKSDYLAVRWYGANSNSKFNYKTEKNGVIVESAWQRIPGATDVKSARLHLSSESYAKTLTSLTSLYFQLKY